MLLSRLFHHGGDTEFKQAGQIVETLFHRIFQLLAAPVIRAKMG
jgi:hypothetical protein